MSQIASQICAKLPVFRFVHQRKGAQNCRKFVANLKVMQFRTISCKYPFSNALFSKYLISLVFRRLFVTCDVFTRYFFVGASIATALKHFSWLFRVFFWWPSSPWKNSVRGFFVAFSWPSFCANFTCTRWADPGVLWKKAPRAMRAMRGKTLETVPFQPYFGCTKSFLKVLSD